MLPDNHFVIEEEYKKKNTKTYMRGEENIN